MAANTARKVRLTEVPADLVMRERDHLDGLLRELYGSGLVESDTSHVAGRLASLMDGVLAKAAPVRDACWSAARSSGDKVTVEAEVSPTEAQALDGILIVLEQAEAFCQEERLYARPAPAEVAELRAWMASEVKRQLEGGAPTPCPAHLRNRSFASSMQPTGSDGTVSTLARPVATPVDPRPRPSAPAPPVADMATSALQEPKRSGWWDR
ncbi:MAG TPA: hypothetical protein VFA11_01925 [Acidimicrobiales bacterium]|nr:hypothetical protein [Acidimicrobiales bacterium]